MRCRACNCELNDYESVRKDLKGVYTDLCSECWHAVSRDLNITDPIKIKNVSEDALDHTFSEWSDD